MSKLEDWTLCTDLALDFHAPELTRLSAIWAAKAAAAPGGLPAREDFDVETLKPFLRHISIVERAMHPAGHQSYIHRAYGRALMQRFGEQTGQFLEMSIPPARVARWVRSYDMILEMRQPMRFRASFQIPRMSYQNGESFCAPLANGGRKPVAILACTYFTTRVELAAQSA